MSRQSCPTQRVLLAYQTGELDETTAESVIAHVTTCGDCQAELATLDQAGDPFVEALRASVPEDPYAQEPQLARMLQNAMSLHVGDPSAGRASDVAAPNGHLVEALGEYELLEQLGAGGMGAVYKARQKKLKQLAAIKLLPKDRLSDPRAVARFEREMEAVGAVSHPNIVRAMYAGEDRGMPYLVVEYVDGLDLAGIVTGLGALPIADACELMRQTAVGLQHVHEQGMVHRDIKPSNLMLAWTAERNPVSAKNRVSDRGAMVKILDLGLALLGVNQPNRLRP